MAYLVPSCRRTRRPARVRILPQTRTPTPALDRRFSCFESVPAYGRVRLVPQSVRVMRNELVYARLRADILGGRLRPGQRVPVATPCTQYGTSVWVLRERVARLTEQ